MAGSQSTPLSEEEGKGGNELLSSIGQIMTSWQGLEFAICEIYLAFFPISLRDVPSLVYHSIRTFEARLVVADALIKRYCNKSQIKRWSKLLSTLRTRKRARNDVAHGMATIFGDTPNRKWGVGKSPYDLDGFTTTQNANDYWTVKELDENFRQISLLTKDLDDFRASLESDTRLQSRLISQQNDVLKNNRAVRVVVQIPPKP